MISWFAASGNDESYVTFSTGSARLFQPTQTGDYPLSNVVTNDGRLATLLSNGSVFCVGFGNNG
jgi:hypothetical protein